MAADLLNTVLVISVVVLVLSVTGLVNFSSLAGVADGEAGVTVVRVEADKACGATTMTVDFVKKYAESTDLTAQNATVYINGGKKGIFSEGGTFTAQGGDELNVYAALDPAQTTYYASHAAGTIPCTGQTAAFLTSVSFMGAGSLTGISNPPNKVYESSTAATTKVFSDDDNVLLTTTALAIGVGATETAKIILKWQYEEGYGVADGNTLICRFTDSQIDQSQLVASLDGAALTTPATYVPTNTRFALSGANQSTKSWDFPAIDGKLKTSSTLRINIKADDTNQPTAATNVSCEIIDTDLFELDSGGVSVGVEDPDDNSNVGRSTEVVIDIPVS